MQKALLHCLLASVHNARQKVATPGESRGHLTDIIVSFNEDTSDISEVFQVIIKQKYATKSVLARIFLNTFFRYDLDGA